MVDMARSILDQYGDVLLWILFLIVFVAVLGVKYTPSSRRGRKDAAPPDGQSDVHVSD